MSALAKSIDDIVSQSIQDFVQRIADTYELDAEDIMSLWDDNVSSSAKKPKSVPKAVEKPSPAKSTTSEVSKSSSIKSTDTGLVCPYVFARGENKGEVCGCKPKNGNKYCSKHKKYEGETPKEKKVLPSGKKSIVSPSKKVSPKEKSPETILRKHKILNMYWHRETDMVFKSGTDRIVIGKCVNDKLVSLTEEDIEVCKSRRWQYEVVVEDKKSTDIDYGSSDSDKEEDIIEKEMTKAVRKVTAISKSVNDEAIKTKKSLKSVINAQTEDVENILSELQKPSADDSDEELDEELEEENDDQELDELEDEDED
jgi:hypothetical protein